MIFWNLIFSGIQDNYTTLSERIRFREAWVEHSQACHQKFKKSFDDIQFADGQNH